MSESPPPSFDGPSDHSYRSHPYDRNGKGGRGGGRGGGGQRGGKGGGQRSGGGGPMRGNRSGGNPPPMQYGYPPQEMPQKKGEKDRERERPTRTLFVRNINYGVAENTVREMFERYGEMKRFFNLIEKRGMCFITYFDSRVAEKAKRELQGTEFNGRTIDVHYALPKDEENQNQDDKNTGTLFVILRNPTDNPSMQEIKTYFEQYGEVREVRDCKNNANLFQRFVEFYDLRSCEKAYNEANGQPFAGGSFEIKYAFNPKAKQDKKDSKNLPPAPSSQPSYPPQPSMSAPQFQMPTMSTMSTMGQMGSMGTMGTMGSMGYPMMTYGNIPITFTLPNNSYMGAPTSQSSQPLNLQSASYLPFLSTTTTSQNPSSEPQTSTTNTSQYQSMPNAYAQSPQAQAQLLSLLLQQQQQQQQQRPQ